MQIRNDGTLEIGPFVMRYRKPQGEGPHPILMLLHGWTGDENVMWIFTSRISTRYLILAPRGLHPATSSGYGWHPEHNGWPTVEDFLPAADALKDLIEGLRSGQYPPELSFPGLDFSQISWMGFSQGAALTYTYALIYPGDLQRAAGLAGFMPNGAEKRVASHPLAGKPIYVAHGAQDERVPIERARRAVDVLEEAGAQVTYCEADVGHKLSASCFRGLEEFFN